MVTQSPTPFQPSPAARARPASPQRRLGPTGLISGTLIETATGWRPVESLMPGKRVQTLDGGLSRLLRLDRRSLEPAEDFRLIALPGGCFDACSDLVLLPGQPLLVDTLEDPVEGGAPYVMVPALALLAIPGPRPLRPRHPIDVLTPLFAEEEAVYAQSGLLIRCPSLIEGALRDPSGGFFPLLPLEEARQFLRRRARRLDGAAPGPTRA